MANKKVSQLTSKPSVLVTDLFPIADPSTGQLYKTTISDLGTAIGSGVSSVNTLVGAVVLDTDDIQELVSPTNKWFTDTRARAAISGGTGISYNSGTGVITNAVTSGQIATALGYTPANDSLVVKLAGTQTITGAKAFSAGTSFEGGIKLKENFAYLEAGYVGIAGVTGGIRIGVNPSYYSDLIFSASSSHSYTFPSATGTIALTSNLSAYALDSAVVHNTGNETIAGQKTFSSTLYGASAVFSSALNAQSINITGITASPSVYITTNGTNHAVSIVQSGSGYAIYASGNVAVIGTGYFSSSLTAASLSSTAGYNFTLPSASGTLALTSNLSSYLPLSGGTLTGALSGTSAKFAGRIFTTSDAAYGDLVSTNGCLVFSFDATGQEAYLRSYNYTTSLGKPMNFNASKYVFNEGNVGIGTTAPTALLTVAGTTDLAWSAPTSKLQISRSGAVARLQNYDGGNVSSLALQWEGGTVNINSSPFNLGSLVATSSLNSIDAKYQFISMDMNSNQARLRADWLSGAGGASPSMVFWTGGSMSMEIASDGRVLMPKVYNNTSGVSANLFIAADGALVRATSSIKYKKDVINYDKGLDLVQQMRPVYYKGISEMDGDKQFAGFIAEEINDLGLSEFVQFNNDNEVEGLGYGNITALLVNAIKELKSELDTLKNK